MKCKSLGWLGLTAIEGLLSPEVACCLIFPFHYQTPMVRPFPVVGHTPRPSHVADGGGARFP